ncbi:hypothetical protein OPQ81_001549 [Rhizoctonia solani]|nr:hypothetical protein OPQ81_001549 [Rhizoctonia solani]
MGRETIGDRQETKLQLWWENQGGEGLALFGSMVGTNVLTGPQSAIYAWFSPLYRPPHLLPDRAMSTAPWHRLL